MARDRARRRPDVPQRVAIDDPILGMLGSSFTDQDERNFYPSRGPLDYPSPRNIFGNVARVVIVSRPTRKIVSGRPVQISPPHRIGFTVPRETLVCVRRKARREVLFAKRKTGRGSKSARKLSRYSNVSCKG